MILDTIYLTLTNKKEVASKEIAPKFKKIQVPMDMEPVYSIESGCMFYRWKFRHKK